MITCYPSPGKRKGLKLARAFAQGAGGQVAATGAARLHPGAACFYGMTARSLPLIARCRAEGREWYYIDNAYYFGRGDYFRVTRNAYQHDGRGDAGPERFAAFGLAVKPWRKGGGHIVLATQSDLFHRFAAGKGRDQWTAETLAALRAYTDRPVVVCDKPAPPWNGACPHMNFEQALSGAWAVAAHSSSVMVKALLEGVPVFSLAPSMASVLGLDDLAWIEAPVYPDGRAQWLWNLAANQWTRAEMAEGACWRDLNGFR